LKDSLGRSINYLRISVTDLCNLRCQYCMPQSGITKKKHEEMLTIEEMLELAGIFVSMGINKIRLTGGEPLLKKGILALTESIALLNGLKDFSLTTNGVLLKDNAEALKKAGLHRVNISLDTLNPEKYKYITRGGDLANVLEGMKQAMRVGLEPVKINVVLIGGFNDNEIADFAELTKEGFEVRFIELMPVGEATQWSLNQFIPNTTVLERIDLKSVKSNDYSSPARYYEIAGAKGRIGLINPMTCKFCQSCNRIRITSDGKLKTCLHSNHEVDLKKALRENGDVKGLIQKTILQKPEAHLLENKEYLEKNMNQIGG